MIVRRPTALPWLPRTEDAGLYARQALCGRRAPVGTGVRGELEGARAELVRPAVVVPEAWG